MGAAPRLREELDPRGSGVRLVAGGSAVAYNLFAFYCFLLCVINIFFFNMISRRKVEVRILFKAFVIALKR